MNTSEDSTKLRGRTAIVTGGAKGIGLGIARALARRGCDLAIWDMDDIALSDACAELMTFGVHAQGFRVDVTCQEEVALAVGSLLSTNGRIDILVNNAGIGGDMLVTKMDVDFWKRVIDTNLTSQFICCKEVVPHMIKENFGRIVNISSRAWLGNRGQSSYSASKGGVVSLTRSLALEFARNGITVNAVAPGIVDTPLFNGLSSEVKEGLRKTVPMQRIGLPVDIAEAACFFAEPSASYVTGQLLYVCGGRSLSSPSV